MTDRPLTVLFMPESAYGPTGNCVGIGDVLLRRGHRVVFAAEACWKGKLDALGFVEDLVDLAPPADADAEQDPGQFWKEFIRETSPEFRKPTDRAAGDVHAPTWQALIDGAKYCEPQLREIIARQRPDVIVEDNVVVFPALMTSGAPFVRIVSCNPLEVKGPDVPPPSRGCRRTTVGEWAAFRAEYDRTHRPMWADFNAFVVSRARPAAGPGVRATSPSTPTSTSIPEEADYTERRPLERPGTGWTQACARPTSHSSCRRRSRTGQRAVRWSTCRWGRWAAPTST